MLFPQPVPQGSQTTYPVRMVLPSDTAPLLRANFETRQTDTIDYLRLNRRNPLREVSRSKNGNLLYHTVYTPFERATDEWVVMSDGSIAIIRGHDYHVDWIDPTSARRSTPKMSFTWVRITDEQKQRAITDNRTRVDEMNARYINPDTDTPVNGGRPRVFTFFVLPEFNDMPDYVAPFLHGAVIADPDNHIWLPPRTSNNVGVGVLYDVINNDGLVFERVRLPADRRLVGFTTRSTAILAHVVGTKTLLELARVR